MSNILSDTSPVTFADPLPEAADVVIIGAGVIGVSAAWHLARRGVSVLVCEKGRVAGEQSSRNWGWVRQQGRDAAELPIMMESMGIWDGLAEETGEDLGFGRHGVLYLAETESEMAGFERWLETVAKPHQLDSRLLSGAEIDGLIDGKPGQWLGGIHTASDGRAEPFKAVPILARAAQRAGAAIAEDCAVRTLETENGAVSAVATEQGRVRTGAVLCAAGAWSSLFLGNLGIDLPQLTVKSCVARTAPGPEIFAGGAAGPDLAFRRRLDGGYTLALCDYNEHFLSRDSFRYFGKFLPALRASWGETRVRLGAGLAGRLAARPRWTGAEATPFEETRVLNPPVTAETVKLIRERLARRLPALADLPLEETWAGMIDSTPDIVPVMDRAEGTPGLFIATGFSGHGFGIGPAAGRVMADLIQGNPPGHDLARFRLSRFSDGSRIDLGPAL